MFLDQIAICEVRVVLHNSQVLTVLVSLSLESWEQKRLEIAVRRQKFLSREIHSKIPLQVLAYAVQTGRAGPPIVMGRVSTTQTAIHPTLILIRDARMHQLYLEGEWCNG
jgi:hypothetical protein